jgi:hypothetical protein
MAAFSKLTAAAVGVVLGGGAALWLLIPLLRRRLAQSSPTKEIVEVLFFPDLPADLFIAGNTTSRSEETFGLNMQKDRGVPISVFLYPRSQLRKLKESLPQLHIRNFLLLKCSPETA